MRLLVLGGTSEASVLVRRLAGRADIETMLSLAGRTRHPAPAPVPTRVGGFGGIDGLARYLDEQRIDAVIDATHPFAAQISANAASACAQTCVPLALFTRAPWVSGEGDNWTEVADADAAAQALGERPRRVFLTIGRQLAGTFARAGRHHYLLRAIDPPPAEDMPAFEELILARGPFSLEEETDLMRRHRIDVLVAKNAGGSATRAKLDAARVLGLPVVMINRPGAGATPAFTDLEATLGWLDAHVAAS
jgi:precorrin-6A/cobalt-precorrin-6A reductase